MMSSIRIFAGALFLLAGAAIPQLVYAHLPVARACTPNESADILCANDQQYVNDLQANGITAAKSPRELANLGWAICGDLQLGRTRQVEANRVYSYNPSLDPPLNHVAVDLAVQDLCPFAATPHYVPPGSQPRYNLP